MGWLGLDEGEDGGAEGLAVMGPGMVEGPGLTFGGETGEGFGLGEERFELGAESSGIAGGR